MADNPNKGSAISSLFNGGGAAQINRPRLMDFFEEDEPAENDSSRSRPQNNYWNRFRSNGRPYHERPQTSRGKFEKSSQPYYGSAKRNSKPVNGNYSGRTFYSSSMSCDQSQRDDNEKSNSEAQLSNGREETEENATAFNGVYICSNCENWDKSKDIKHNGGSNSKSGDSADGVAFEFEKLGIDVKNSNCRCYPSNMSKQPEYRFNRESSQTYSKLYCLPEGLNIKCDNSSLQPDKWQSSLDFSPVSGNSASNTFEAKQDLPHTLVSGALHEEWVNAPEFIPKGSKPKSYAEVVNPNSGLVINNRKLCPYAEKSGECRMAEGYCPYAHGDICGLCGCAALHPTDIMQRKQHQQVCLARHEKNMEISVAVARSKDKTCGICFEVVVEKNLSERRFGILTQCNHCFCLGCIRKWRQARQFENKVVRACPECRVTSDFVCPSVYWVETKEEKDQLIYSYKNALAKKQCKYFKQGRGSCPFGNKCFYLHALPDGTKTDVGPPPRRRRNNRHRFADDGDLGDMLQQIILWDFLDEHDYWLYSFADGIEELVAFFSDSDESESWSDYELFFD